ncbi:hypothetical protein PHYSODRAFT_342296 [Phytophthora sojae]|uniref:RxLR effector protein n=1 Tax=Phytophthora sojae (strain P6497) TaxID=1094619 RepID=G5AFV7_PHYSP|nr:hypothetical protein PHYSODRAFT_342296 [Phytophthora sojae]EGZ05473.1 hypothetical protein PHYSODRAFT_342296 [Phytophthora sojae]|eukprot:XP_009539004.1 hypothetical protein PHYSODRAFT_342296 [Phytophthora sojae]
MRFAPFLLVIVIFAGTSFAKAGAVVDATDREGEERGHVFFFKQFLGKDSGISSKLSSMKKNPEVAAAMSNPVVNKLGTTIKNSPDILTSLSKNPTALKTLAKDPQVAKAAKVLEKNHVSSTAEAVKSLRSIAAKDPTKADIVSKIIKFRKIFKQLPGSSDLMDTPAPAC